MYQKFKKNFIFIVIVVVGALIYGIALLNFIKEVKTTPNTTIQKEEKPIIELIEYKEEISEFSPHWVYGTYINNSNRPVSITLHLDAYNEKDTYQDTYTRYAQYLEPQKKWDFIIQVPRSTRRVKLREVRTAFRD